MLRERRSNDGLLKNNIILLVLSNLEVKIEKNKTISSTHRRWGYWPHQRESANLGLQAVPRFWMPLVIAASLIEPLQRNQLLQKSNTINVSQRAENLPIASRWKPRADLPPTSPPFMASACCRELRKRKGSWESLFPEKFHPRKMIFLRRNGTIEADGCHKKILTRQKQTVSRCSWREASAGN